MTYLYSYRSADMSSTQPMLWLAAHRPNGASQQITQFQVRKGSSYSIEYPAQIRLVLRLGRGLGSLGCTQMQEKPHRPLRIFYEGCFTDISRASCEPTHQKVGPM